MKFPEMTPAVLGTVMTAVGLRSLMRKTVPADAIEVRVDALLARKVTLDKIEAALKGRKHPALLTLRIPAEGGQIAWKVGERRDLFLRWLPYVEAIDIEVATSRALQPVLEQAHRTGKTVVLSAHAIKTPAKTAQIAHWSRQLKPRFGAILKIASRLESRRDLQQLAGLLINNPTSSIAVMGLGPYAAPSRFVLAALGSRLVYGYLDQPAAAGQPSAVEMRKMVLAARELKGGKRSAPVRLGAVD